MAHFTRIVQNRSSRRGVLPDTIVIHSTEGHNRPGISDLEGLGGWFDLSSAAVSAHKGVDAEGNSATYVPDAEKAWACADWNARTLNLELIGFAAWTRGIWKRDYRKGLNTAAKIVAEWSIKHNIPLDRRVPKGVGSHEQLGEAGGNHHDPGKGFPWRLFMLLAKLQKRRLLKRTNESINRRLRDRIMRAFRS
jgi:N-acetyl-anhydromuramyl-L-alanine amidase AmpD